MSPAPPCPECHAPENKVFIFNAQNWLCSVCGAFIRGLGVTQTAAPKPRPVLRLIKGGLE